MKKQQLSIYHHFLFFMLIVQAQKYCLFWTIRVWFSAVHQSPATAVKNLAFAIWHLIYDFHKSIMLHSVQIAGLSLPPAENDIVRLRGLLNNNVFCQYEPILSVESRVCACESRLLTVFRIHTKTWGDERTFCERRLPVIVETQCRSKQCSTGWPCESLNKEGGTLTFSEFSRAVTKLRKNGGSIQQCITNKC